jgi:hypothetical protein
MFEKRKRLRVEVELPVLILQGGGKFRLKTKNISLKGLLATGEPSLVCNERCQLKIFLSSDSVIEIEGKVVRSDKKEVAVDFIQLDETSFYYLHNLVRFQSMDPDKVDEEMHIPAFDLKDLNK